MILTEQHFIKIVKQQELLKKIDEYCYAAKNLSNSVNYIIKQCYRIHQKLKNGDILDSWEKKLIYDLNCAIHNYNHAGKDPKNLKYIDENNSFIADAYFLSWYMKSLPVYKAMPYATCSQICIQEKCREWKSFYCALIDYSKNPGKYLGRPSPPRYLDSKTGRGRIVITNQNFTIDEMGNVIMPRFLSAIKVKARHKDVKQLRVCIADKGVSIQLMYEQTEKENISTGITMGVDLGVNNLMAVAINSDKTPFIINGRPLKSINQYYNKKRAYLQSISQKSNKKYNTSKINALTKKRNAKIKDYLHKASHMLVKKAEKEGVSFIVIGLNNGWKQNKDMGKKTNQNFLSIPHTMLINMIKYKAAILGIKVKTVQEKYTSGTSYLDGEYPKKESYNKARRIKRGLFKSNRGILINADINAAYQIMKVAGSSSLKIKENEKIEMLNVA